MYDQFAVGLPITTRVATYVCVSHDYGKNHAVRSKITTTRQVQEWDASPVTGTYESTAASESNTNA